MIFQSLDYFVFLICVLAVYWNLPHRAQNLFLVAAGYVFYGWVHPWFLIPFLVTTVVDYFVAIGIESIPARRRQFLFLNLATNLGMLGVFKYFNFFAENIQSLLGMAGIHVSGTVLQIVLPVGISFYTFQSIGYVVEVYRGNIRACRDFLNYALFVSFFPQLVAGPIQRAGFLLKQVCEKRSTTPALVRDALFLILWGVFKKVVIADNVAITANKVFALRNPSFPILWVGVLAFCVQIYADFSAYTDIARGSARLFGFELIRNFDNPYLAQSPTEFWKRWHISLSSWIRDYIYIPLGGSRVNAGRGVANILIVFFLTGLWHGASWNYVLWGVYHGMLIVIYRVAGNVLPLKTQNWRGAAVARVCLMFVLTNIGWLIFREQNAAALWQDLTLNPFSATRMDWKVAIYLASLAGIYTLPLCIHTVASFWLPKERREPSGLFLGFQTAVLTAAFLGILVLRSSVGSDFIYFQF